MSVLDTLKSASRRTTEITLCIDSALQSEWEAANQGLDVAGEKDLREGSLEDPQANLKAAAEVMADVERRMESSKVTFKFEQMPWTERLALQAEHPPRKENLADNFNGYNIETFAPALIRASCVSVTDTAGDEATDVPDDVWDTLLANLNYQQVNLLSSAAFKVNDQETQVPTSARSLIESLGSGASLEQPSPGTSPRSGSAAGSRRGSRKSSATKKAASPDS